MDRKYFKQTEIDRMQRLMAVVVKDAKWSKSVDEFITIYNEIDWVKKTLIPKMESHIFDEIQITNPVKAAKGKKA